VRSVLLLCILSLAVPAVASSYRGPTPSQTKKINQAAHRSSQTEGFGCFNVDFIKVSTEGPWAGGSLRSCKDKNAVIFGLFSRRDGKWKLRRLGNGAVGCDIAPKKVQQDLDLGCP
jgi:stress response protein SCP2